MDSDSAFLLAAGAVISTALLCLSTCNMQERYFEQQDKILKLEQTKPRPNRTTTPPTLPTAKQIPTSKTN